MSHSLSALACYVGYCEHAKPGEPSRRLGDLSLHFGEWWGVGILSKVDAVGFGI